MARGKPSNKGTAKGNSRNTVAKTSSGDKYKNLAMESWKNGREQLVAKLSANTGLPIEEKAKKSTKKRLANQQQSNSTPL